MRKYFLLIMIIVLTMLSIVVMGCEEKAESSEQGIVNRRIVNRRKAGEWQATEFPLF